MLNNKTLHSILKSSVAKKQLTINNATISNLLSHRFHHQ